ncbi:MAG: M16 family metallopeptidase [Candidatus Avigastranaerophilus sp.]
MENIKKSLVRYPFLERPVEIYERECGHKIIWAYKEGSLLNISSWVKTGSINENDENNGISHFLEHLMFKGTSKHKAGYFDRTLEAKGAVVNAATWKDYTFYYVTVPKGNDDKNLQETIELHADMMLNPVIPPEEIGEPFDLNQPVTTKRERHVVIEEIRMRKDQPWTMVYNSVNANLYSNHPYKRDVIGNEQIISTIKRETILDYYEKFYTPDNITTIIAGDINPDYVIAKIAKEFDFKGRKNHPKQEYKIDLQPIGGKYTEEYSKINTGFVMFGYLGAKANDIRTSLVLEMICSVLGDGLSSRLQQELIEKASEQIFNGVGAYYYPFRDGGNIFVQANFKPEAKNTVLEKLKQQIEILYTNGISEQELKKAKKKIKAGFASNSESVTDIADTIGYYITVPGGLNYVEEYADTIDKITAEEIKETAAKYMDINNVVISVLMPEEYKNEG